MTVLRALTVLVLALGAASSGAQPAGKLHRIGFLSGYSAVGAAPIRAILVEALAGLGYREGRDIVLVERYADGKLERLPPLARDLLREGVDVITTQTTPAALAAKGADSRVPIVNITSGDAVGSGLVPNLARPGGNVTGLSFLGVELAVKQMELLRELAPSVSHIGLLANPGIRPEQNFFREMERAAASQGVRVSFIEASTSRDYDAAFMTIAQKRIDGLVVAPSVANHDEWQKVVVLSAKFRLPTIYPYRDFVDAGGLLSYGFNRREFYGRAAVYVDKILKGANAGDLPIEQPSRFELIVNVPTVRNLGLNVPGDMLLRANSVIQ